MRRKLQGRKRRASKRTWCMVYTDDLRLLAFIEYDKWIYTSNNYFEGTKTQIRREARKLGLDFSEWNEQQDERRNRI